MLVSNFVVFFSPFKPGSGRKDLPFAAPFHALPLFSAVLSRRALGWCCILAPLCAELLHPSWGMLHGLDRNSTSLCTTERPIVAAISIEAALDKPSNLSIYS